MKYRELYNQGMEKLSSENMFDAKTDARLLLEYACKTDRNALFLQGDMEVTEEDEKAYLEEQNRIYERYNKQNDNLFFRYFPTS